MNAAKALSHQKWGLRAAKVTPSPQARVKLRESLAADSPASQKVPTSDFGLFTPNSGVRRISLPGQ
eukprot:4007730-Prymnesium_polylepis.1